MVGLSYLGGNGFYWRIVRHPEDPALLEIRRSEDGLRAWASEPGEYYNAFDGSYGGLWRRNGRPPQQLVGIGFTAQGNFVGMPYKRVCYDKNMDWVFDGIMTICLAILALADMARLGLNLIGVMKSWMTVRISPSLRNLMTRITALFLFQKKC